MSEHAARWRRTLQKTRQALGAGIQHLGLDVRRYRAHPFRPADLKAEPQTILDVGAADGTPELYEAYGSALIVAFEPMPEQLEALKRKFATRELDLQPFALGATAESVELHVDLVNVGKTSLHDRTKLTRSKTGVVTRHVEVRTLDELVEANAWSPPFVLKIDTEGHELDVLRGARRTLEATAVLHIETSVGRRFTNGYRFSDVARFLIDLDFDLVDVTAAPRASDGRTAFLDCVWLPKRSSFDAD